MLRWSETEKVNKMKKISTLIFERNTILISKKIVLNIYHSTFNIHDLSKDFSLSESVVFAEMTAK